MARRIFFHSVSVLNVSVHTTLKKIENAIITKQFGFVFKKNPKSYRDLVVFEKLRFQNVFRPNKNKPALLNSSGFQ